MHVGIIGAGIQAKSAHLPTFSKLDDVEVVGIADINEKPAKLLAKKFDIPNVYTNYYDLINNNNIDLISICTPHHLHKQMAIDCALAGKHILIEKPMTTTVKDADEILHAVKENNVKLGVIQNYRLFPSIKEAKMKIEKGRIGEIVSMHGYGHVFQSFGKRSTPWILTKGSAGIIEDFGSHLIDIILYLNSFNKIDQIHAIGGNFGGNLDLIAHCQILIEFENRSTASLDLSCLSGAKETAVYIQGHGGLLHIDVRNDYLRETHQYNTPIDDLLLTFTKLSRITKGIINKRYFLGAKVYYFEIIKNLIDSIEKNARVLITGEECRNTALVIENAQKSIKEHRPIKIDEEF